MKSRIFFIALLLIQITACKDEKKEKLQNPEPPKVIPTVMPAELHGTWVKADYMEDIATTKSPYKSFKKLEGIALFSFDTAQMQGTQLKGGVSYNGHEGGQCIVEFQSGKTPRSIVLKHLEGDTAKTLRELVLENNELFLMSYPTNGGAIGERYVSASKKDASIDNALDHAVRRALFEGKWQWKDAGTNKVKEIELKDDGTIVDSIGFVKYTLLTDYMADAPSYDQLFLFDAKLKRPRIVQYKISGDTIRLTERIKKKEIPVYVLVKKK